LRTQPLKERKSTLEKLLGGANLRLHYSDHLAEPGSRVLSQACAMALEGIVSKRFNAPYGSGRHDQWVKSKCLLHAAVRTAKLTKQASLRSAVISLGCSPRSAQT
jgi:bifunctional non-homologous end joining protein LigD